MRAWLLDATRGPGTYRLGETPTPEPGPWEVRVALRASAMNHLDIWVAHGMPSPPSLPHVAGADGAGVIDAVGDAVEDVTIGEEVVIDPATSCAKCAACLRGDVPLCASFGVVGEHRWGTHAEAVVLPAANVAPKPADESWEDAAAFGLVMSSAVRMLRRGRVSAGDRVLVVGVGGGSATAAFMAARATGAEVYATSTSDDKLGWAREHGAVGTFSSKGPFDEEMRTATAGRGADVVLDNVGSATFERSLKALTRGGRLVVNGSTSGRTTELHMPTLFWRQLEVIGSSMNDHREFAEAVRLVAEGVRVPIDSVTPFDEFPVALERLEAGDQLGKLILSR